MTTPPDASASGSNTGSSAVWSDGTVTVAGAWSYRFDHDRHPHVHPLRTPAGHVLTTDAPADHPWHHALWFAVKFVDGENFWEEFDAFGVQRHTDDPPVVVAESPTGGTTVAGWLDWIGPDGATVVLRERRLLTHRPLDATSYAIDWSVELHPAADVVLDREPFNGLWGGYSGLTFRGRPDLVDTRLLLADGTESDRLLGVPATALDLSGTVDGAPVGVALLDGTGNARSPVPWYASTRNPNYGDEGWSNFVNAAFLWDEPLAVPRGERLRVDHRVVVHDGHWDLAALQAAVDAYHHDLAATP